MSPPFVSRIESQEIDEGGRLRNVKARRVNFASRTRSGQLNCPEMEEGGMAGMGCRAN